MGVGGGEREEEEGCGFCFEMWREGGEVERGGRALIVSL